MATEDGRESAGLNQELFRAPYRFDFFQAVRLLEHRRRERARQELGQSHRPVGHDDPRHEIVAFRAHPSLSFPAGAISQIREAVGGPGADHEAPPPELVVAFLGLTGPSGVLPRHYTELLIQRIREKDYSLRDFLDLFNHRVISLFYRAWEKYRLPIGYERSQLDDPAREPDLVTRSLYCLVGFGTEGLRGRLEVDDEVFLHYSGHFAHFPRTALSLECLLEDYLEMPARVLQVQGQWLNLDSDDQSFMPSARYPKGRNNQLGVNLVVGEWIWDIQSKFRLRLGPLSWRQFQSLMPNGTALRPLCQITRTFVGPDLDFDVQPVLRAKEVPPCRLDPRSEEGPYLGWNTWMLCQPFRHPVDDAVFEFKEI
jgi:type VI secretion system protein ImpH